MADEKKLTGYVLCVLQDPVEPNLIFVGTEQGLWVSMDNGNQFQQFKNGYPSVSTYDLAIQEREADLVIGTFGRALWILDDIRPLRKLAANKGQVPAVGVTAFQPPAAYQANIKNASGIEYSTWGTYEGENRRTGAPISFFVNRAARDTGKNKLPDTAQIRIFDGKQQQVRSLKAKADSGFNRFFWGMEGKGIRQAGMGGRGGGRMGGRSNTDEPGGLPVDPGTYKVVISLGKEFSDSCMITINDDPNAPLDPAVRQSIREANKELDKSALKMTDLVDRMNEAEEVIKKVEAGYKDMEAGKTDTLKKVSKAMQDSIKGLREMMYGKTQEKQGYGNVPQVTVNSLMSDARMNILGKRSVPGAQEQRLMKDASDAVNRLVERANGFFSGPWKNYRSLVESVPVKMFKDYVPLQ